jgi:hypothetical protein
MGIKIRENYKKWASLFLYVEFELNFKQIKVIFALKISRLNFLFIQN